MTETNLRSLLKYINSFWSTDDLVIKGSVPHFLKGKTKREPLDIDIMFLGARDHDTIERKWNSFISHFELDYLDYERKFFKVYFIKFKNESIRVEINFQDNLPRSFLEPIPGFSKLQAPKYEYWVLSKVHSISYYMSYDDRDKERLENIINDLQSVKKADIPKIKSQTVNYLEFALNNMAFISYNTCDVYLDADFLNKGDFLKRIQKYIAKKPIAKELIDDFFKNIKKELFTNRIEDLDVIYDHKEDIETPEINDEEEWYTSNNIIVFDDVWTIIKVTNEILNKIYENEVKKDFFENINMILLDSSTWNFDNIYLKKNFNLDYIKNNVKSFSKKNFIPIKVIEDEYVKNSIVLPVKYENYSYHLLINNYYYFIILLFINEDESYE